MRKPWLWLPPQLAHDLVPWGLPVAAWLFPQPKLSYQPRQWRGLHFQNPLGIAGGVDKAGNTLTHWQKLGCGFVEVGTVTPLAQGPNPGTIMNRSVSKKAVWNKMGFPNQGAEVARQTLASAQLKLKVPVFVNIGKNRTTENAVAHQDYIRCMEILKDEADAFVINISSPNTQGLRDLLSEDYLHSFISPICDYKKAHGIEAPLLMKLSPDMHPSELESVLETSLWLDIDGWILTNTTASRPPGIDFPKEGGLSGEPLKTKSVETLNAAIKYLGERKGDRLLVSAGGVGSASDVRERLSLGADLVQVYSALIFEGPLFFQHVLKELIRSN